MRMPEMTATGTGGPAGEDPLVLPLEAIHGGTDGRAPTAAGRAYALRLTGGKAANLGELIGAGLPVPPGFCLTTRAYALAAAAAGVDELVRELEGTKPGGPEAARVAAEIRARLSGVTVPEAVRAAASSSYGALGGTGERVAVRSSATAEDLPFASFAGQQDTFLGVTGEDALLDAIRRCWASLWTDRAVSYRTSNGIDHGSVRLAVVVQRMVAARAAGVLFTADPLTGRRGRAVVDAAPGLGEAVVSGAVNPDHFVVESATGAVLDRRLGDKRVKIVQAAGGGVERVERDAPAAPADGADAPDAPDACLTDTELAALARLGGRVEDHYGAPQDIEWAVDAGGGLWLTQARPVTTIYPLPPGAAGLGPDELRVYFSANVAQGVFGPLTPMGISVFRLLGSSVATVFGVPPADPAAGPPVLAVAGSRLYLDVTAIARSKVGRRVAPPVLGIMEARSRVVFESLLDDPRLSVVQSSPWPFLRRVIPPLVRAGTPPRLVRAVARPAILRALLARMEARVRALTDLPDDTPAERRVAIIENVMLTELGTFLPRVMPSIMLPYIGLQRLALRALGDRADEGALHTVLRGLPYNPTTEMDLELWDLAAALRADPETRRLVRDTPPAELARRYHAGELPADAQRRLAAFLDAYGHRGVAEIDVGVARWAEDPAHILNALANYLRLDDAEAAPAAQFERSRQAGEAAVAELAGRVGGVRGRLVRFCLSRVREIGGLRERPKFIIALLFARLRGQLLRVGADLVAMDRLAAAEDIFLVDLGEVREALDGRDLRQLVRDRRGLHEAEARRRHVPRILLSDGSDAEAVAAAAVPAAADADALRGSPASPGRVTASARVVLDPAGARLEPGEILVAPSTDPGWTPLFLTAGGLVMEMGGAMSHGAVVAREYGIPAVVGVAYATSAITTGQAVTVDGSAGSVVVRPEPAAGDDTVTGDDTVAGDGATAGNASAETGETPASA